MVGYYKQPELTEAAFTEDGFLKTGDRGEIDAEGRLRITGRVKELFKTSKGKYVAPAPIENLINVDSNIELSCVSGSGYPVTHVVVQLAESLLPKLGDAAVKSQIMQDLEALLTRVNGQIEEFEKIGFIVVVKERWSIEGGHLTPTMKMKRPVIEDLYKPQLDGWYASGKKVIWEA
jgi:long-subunit acyl-CoA synthetase (AMP-forming)